MMEEQLESKPQESSDSNPNSPGDASGDEQSNIMFSSMAADELGQKSVLSDKGQLETSASRTSLLTIPDDTSSVASDKDTSFASSLFSNPVKMPDNLDHHLVNDPAPQVARHVKAPKSDFAIERQNLINLLKLVNKSLIESCINTNRMIDYDKNQFLHHFFNVLEQVFKHGLKGKKTILFGRKEIWPIFESLERFLPSSRDLIASVRDLPSVKTTLGKSRAFIRLAFVQKYLPDYFRFIMDRKDLLNKFYEPEAILMREEAEQVHGILIGLSIMDCNWCPKDEDLDNLSLTIDWTPYLRLLKNVDDGPSPEENEELTVLQKVSDQKNYVEELNRRLSTKINTLNERIKYLETNKEPQPFSLRETITQILGESIGKLSIGGDELSTEDMLKKLSDQDPAKIREMLESREKLTQELEAKVEREHTIESLEKELNEKQETIVALRKQLEDVKAINIQLYNKLKECEQTLKGKIEQLSLMEQKNSIMEATLLQYEAKSVAAESKYCALAESHKRTCEQFVELGNAKSKLDQNLLNEIKEKQKLEKENRRLSEQTAQLQQELKDIKETNFDFDKLRREYLNLQQKCSEYELSMEELGIKLQSTTLETEQLKETAMPKDAVWEPDNNKMECSHCNKPFTVARRKHHCRNCGHIFCAACSDNKLPLPSSSKPCRVCDACHVALLERYSAK